MLGVAGVIVALDQLTKYLVMFNLELGQSWSPFDWLMPYARIVHWNNTGAAFGLFKQGSLIFTVIAIVVVLAILYYYPRIPEKQVALRFALMLQLGGAAGNLTSRLIHGTVTDFISLSTFPVFNVADASISIGVAILIASMWVEERRSRNESADINVYSQGDEEEDVTEGERQIE
jgi:signal peptidase II